MENIIKIKPTEKLNKEQILAEVRKLLEQADESVDYKTRRQLSYITLGDKNKRRESRGS